MKIYCARNRYKDESDFDILMSIVGKDVWIRADEPGAGADHLIHQYVKIHGRWYVDPGLYKCSYMFVDIFSGDSAFSIDNRLDVFFHVHPEAVGRYSDLEAYVKACESHTCCVEESELRNGHFQIIKPLDMLSSRELVAELARVYPDYQYKGAQE